MEREFVLFLEWILIITESFTEECKTKEIDTVFNRDFKEIEMVSLENNIYL